MEIIDRLNGAILVNMNKGIAAAVIAGLAVGIALIVLFASMFSPSIQKKYFANVSILGLKDSYAAHERIDFSVRVSGYSPVCGVPAVTIVNLDDPAKVINPVDLIVDYNCDPEAGYFDRTWTLADIGVTHDITLESGNYKVVARYIETAEKEFEVTPDAISPDMPRVPMVSCLQSSFCTYNLAMNDDIYPINYRMNGTIENMIADVEARSLALELTAQSSGSLHIAIPRKVIDAESEFVVFVNEVAVDVDEIPIQAHEWTKVMGISENPEDYRILVIPIQSGKNEVEVVSDYLI